MPQPPVPAVEFVPTSRLFCSPSNPRQNDASVPHVAASLRRFGWEQPVVARRTGEVVAGNTRLMAAQLLGLMEVPVWWFDGSDIDAVAYAVADNKTHEFSYWEDAALTPCARLELALRPDPEPNSHHTPTVLTFDVISLPVLSSAKAWMPAHWPTGIVGGIENVRLRTPDAGAICRSLHTLVTSM